MRLRASGNPLVNRLRLGQVGRAGAIASSSESSRSMLRKYHRVEQAVDSSILLLISLKIIFRKSL